MAADDPKKKPPPGELAGGPGSAKPRQSDTTAVTVPAKDSQAGVFTVPAPPSWDSLRGELVVHEDGVPPGPLAGSRARAGGGTTSDWVDTKVDVVRSDDEGETTALDTAARAVARATLEEAIEEPDGDTEVHMRASLDELAAQHDGDTDVHDTTKARMEALAAEHDGDTDVRDVSLDGTTAVRDVSLDGTTDVRDVSLDGTTAVRDARPPAPGEAPAAALAPARRTPPPPPPARSATATPLPPPPARSATATPLPPPPARSATPLPPPPARSATPLPPRSATATPLPPPPARSATATPLPAPPARSATPLPPPPARSALPPPGIPSVTVARPTDRNKATVPDLKRALEAARGSGAFDIPLPRAGDAKPPADAAPAIPPMAAAQPLQAGAKGPPPLAIHIPLGRLAGALPVPPPPSSHGTDEDFWSRDTSEHPKVMIRETAALPLVRLADGTAAAALAASVKTASDAPPTWPPPRESVPRPPWAGAKAEAEMEALRAENRRLRARVRTATAVTAVALLGAGVVALLYVQQSRRMPAVEPAAIEQPAKPVAPLRQGFEAKSTEQGVRVFVDGSERGTLPLVVDDLTPGPHRVRFERASGRGSSERVVEVAPGGVTDLGTIELPAP